VSTSLLLTALDLSDPSRLGRILPAPTTGSAQMPEQRVRTHLSVPGFSNDLTLEKWGVIIPEKMEVRLEWIRQLRELRAKQCGLPSLDELQVLPVKAGMTRQDAHRWRVDVYEALSSAKRPGYLLLLGDLSEISHELQLELMVSASVGRLCFTDESGQPDRKGYESYCAKVCESEGHSADWNESAQLLFYCSRDGSTAVEDGYHDLISRSHTDAFADTQPGGSLQATSVAPILGAPGKPRWDSAVAAGREGTLMFHAEKPRPSVMFSLTHGLGSAKPSEQRLRQGIPALSPGSSTGRAEVVEASSLDRAFLPRGFWFFKACFSAGTAATSVYEPWLKKLQQLGATKEDPGAALQYLAKDGQTPFVARLPQVALAHPQGPIGVLGHVDLAWTYGNLVRDEDDPTATQVDRNTFYDVLRMVAGGNRLGPSIASLSETVQKLGTDLAALYGERELDGADSVDRHAVLRAWMWMRYLDLAGYLLLGDPAAQVPTSAARAIANPAGAAAGNAANAANAAAAAAPSVEKMERAVLACLRGGSPTEIAKKEGVHPTKLERWVKEYKAAGRAALAANPAAPRREPEKPS
jgi:Helix-turn-helix domain